MIEPQFLSVADVLTIHEEQIEAYGGIRGIRDEGLLYGESVSRCDKLKR